MADRDQPIRAVWPPKPGFFRLRLVRGGWAAPAQIILKDGKWQAIIDGEEGQPHENPVIAGVDIIWHYGAFSDATTYKYLNALREWARAHRTGHPAEDATKPISKVRMQPISV